MADRHNEFTRLLPRRLRNGSALTLVVSLEAIFLSTFVMIGQNRQSEFQQAKADHDFQTQEVELKTNTQLTREIHTLTTELHKRIMAGGPDGPAAT